jgi:hypothetical protein
MRGFERVSIQQGKGRMGVEGERARKPSTDKHRQGGKELNTGC